MRETTGGSTGCTYGPGGSHFGGVHALVAFVIGLALRLLVNLNA